MLAFVKEWALMDAKSHKARIHFPAEQRFCMIWPDSYHSHNLNVDHGQ